jgi:hypothetical protein
MESVGRMGGNQKGFSAIGECGVGNLRRTERRLLTATALHLKGQKIADCEVHRLLSSRARSSVIDTFDDIGCRGFIAARLEARPKHLSFSRKRSHQGQHRDCKQYPSQNVTSIPMVLIVSNR